MFFCDSVSVTTIVQPNNPPNAITDTINLIHSNIFIVSPMLNDSDPDEDNISILSFGTAALGTVVSASATKFQYTAPYGYCGIDSF